MRLRVLPLLVFSVLIPSLLRASGTPYDPKAWAEADKANEPVAKKLASEFEAAFRNTHEPTRIKAIAAVSVLNHPLVVKVLGATLTQGGAAIRIAGAEAMGLMEHRPEAERLLAAAVKPNSKSTDVLVALYKAMGSVGDVSGVPALVNELSSRLPKTRGADLSLVQTCVESLGKIHDKKAVDAMIDVWQKADPESRPTEKTPQETSNFREGANTAFNLALASLTGERERPWSEWKSWWKKAKTTFVLPEGPDAPPPAAPGASAVEVKPDEGDKPEVGEEPKEGEKPKEGGDDKGDKKGDQPGGDDKGEKKEGAEDPQQGGAGEGKEGENKECPK